jgi:hypothetical protein
MALALAVAMASLLAPVASRRLLQGSLSIKLYCPGLCLQEVISAVSNDINAVDSYAMSRGRQRVNFAGTIAPGNLTNELGTFDMLLVHNFWSRQYGRIFEYNDEMALASSLASGSLKKLMVW